MAVYKRGKIYWYKFNWFGDTIRESTKQGNPRVARQMEAAHKTSLAKGEVGIRETTKVPTLKDFAPRFETAIETLCGDKPATVSFYKDKLKGLLSFDAFASARLDRIDEALIEDYKQKRTKQVSRRDKPFAVGSVNRELATLRRLLRLAQERKILDRVPRVRLLRGENCREFVLNHEQEPIYLSAAPDDLRDVALLLLDTGLRIGEALSLEWPDVHLEPADGAKFGYLTVRKVNSKNSKPRNIPLTDRVHETLLHRSPTKTGRVFHREDGSPLCQTWLNQQHCEVRRLLGMPEDFVPHSLRHTFGTRLGESGADAFTIMRLMGHSTVTVSQRYVHPSPETMERAVERLEALNERKRQRVGTNIGTTVEVPVDIEI
jgi:integrase